MRVGADLVHILGPSAGADDELENDWDDHFRDDHERVSVR